jgi:hypothetical protein
MHSAYYSLRNAFTGLLNAALTLCTLTVIKASRSNNKGANTKMNQPHLIWKAKLFNHLLATR